MLFNIIFLILITQSIALHSYHKIHSKKLQFTNSIKINNLYYNNYHHQLILKGSTSSINTKLNLCYNPKHAMPLPLTFATTSLLSLPMNAWSSTLSTVSSLTSLTSLSIADGLDAETLGALGDVQELTDALNDAIDVSNPTADILTKLVDSPFILIIPIGAGLLVAAGVGFLIYSYGKGNE